MYSLLLLLTISVNRCRFGTKTKPAKPTSTHSYGNLEKESLYFNIAYTKCHNSFTELIMPFQSAGCHLFFSGHNLMKEPAKTISVSRCRFGFDFFFHRCEVGRRNIYPAKPTSTLSYCFFTISVSRCRFGTKKKPAKPTSTHSYCNVNST